MLIQQKSGRMQLLLMMFMLVVPSLMSIFRDGVKVVYGFIIPMQQQHQKFRPIESFARTGFLHEPIMKNENIGNSKLRIEMAVQENDTGNNVDDEDENETPSFNPYADPNYPELEFVNYDDPEYSIDRSLNAAEANVQDETLLEQMREERRVSNDEYQYNTYWHTVWNAGLSTYRGEWTVYYSSNFFPQFDDYEDETEAGNGLPRLIQLSDAPLTVVSRAVMQNTTTDATNEYELSAQSYITHVEELEEGMGDADLALAGGADELEQSVVSQTYWPTQLCQSDFRGQQGIMICGNAYTICTTVPLVEEESDLEGPFREYRVELGICADDELRFRVKLDYNVLDEIDGIDIESPPPLHLKTMVVCRESADKWPRSSSMAQSLFGSPAGAPGGLYDPPLVGGPSRSDQYCQLDLDGTATALFPIVIDQIVRSESVMESDTDPSDLDDRVGWVTSLDWTAGSMRYQVDRKVNSGRYIRGLRTLELSEVQGVDADRYRPRDGGQNMRQ